MKVPLLNFEVDPGSQIPGPEVASLGVRVQLLHHAFSK